MMAVNYERYDDRETLRLSEAGHLWVEMMPVARRGGINFPGPADEGWKYAFWCWLKDEINRRLQPTHYPKGFHRFRRSLFDEIAKSEAYAEYVEHTPELRLRPLFLFKNERPWSRARAYNDALEWLKKLLQEPGRFPFDDFRREAKRLFQTTKQQARDAWNDAHKELGITPSSGPIPKSERRRDFPKQLSR